MLSHLSALSTWAYITKLYSPNSRTPRTTSKPQHRCYCWCTCLSMPTGELASTSLYYLCNQIHCTQSSFTNSVPSLRSFYKFTL